MLTSADALEGLSVFAENGSVGRCCGPLCRGRTQARPVATIDWSHPGVATLTRIRPVDTPSQGPGGAQTMSNARVSTASPLQLKEVHS